MADTNAGGNANKTETAGKPSARILSGIQPTGDLHIGNFFGMMEPAIRLQDEGDAFYFIADYHALTTVHDPATMRGNVTGVATDFLSAGLDPSKATFFRQSDVPEVAELSWFLSTVCPVGFLERAHSFKDKTARGIDATHGLFAYPVLMAADILIYDSNIVPVGKDQKQHLEITRDLAGKFNDRFGEGVFTIPEPRIAETGSTAAVPGLDGQKMSKSYNNTLALFEEEKKTRKKIMKIVTDATPVEDPKPTEDSTLLDYYRLFATDDEVAEMVASFNAGGTGYGHYKQQVFEKLWERFAPMRERREKLLADPDYVEDVLITGAKRARRHLAQATLARVREATGIAGHPISLR